MGIKGTIRRVAERLTGTKILRYSELPRGFDIFNDLSQCLYSYQISVIFDVGANIGQTAEEYVKHYPSANIHCFEPITETFNQLRQNMEGFNQVKCFQLAFGSTNESGNMLSEGVSTMNHLLKDIKDSINNEIETENVEVMKLDDFCKNNSVNEINYLKIDTEGGDLDVLKGAQNMLLNQKIDIVEVEAGMNCNNTHHVSFEALKAYLEKYDYYLFGVYEQFGEWPTKEPHLRRANSVFISNDMKNRYKAS